MKAGKRILPAVLAAAVALTTAVVCPNTVKAAGYLDYVQGISLGQNVTGVLDTSDYCGKAENSSYESYWDVYQFTMVQDSVISAALESSSDAYFYNNNDARWGHGAGIAIYNANNPDVALWNTNSDFKLSKNYSAARGMYYGSARAFLAAGTYYFVIRQRDTNTTGYSLTLSIGVSNITINQTALSLNQGEQAQLVASVVPDNALDKSVTWSSDKTDVAVVSPTGVVTAMAKGTAKITATDASGEVSAYCQVTVAEPITSAVITAMPTGYTYDGYAKTPIPTIQVGSDYLNVNTDYTISYQNNVNAGTGTAIITGIGNYSGQITTTFKIAKGNNPMYLTTSYKYYARKSLKKAAKFAIGAKGKGKLTYSLSKKAKKAKIKVSAKGKVTVPKKCKKGTYTITVKAAGSKNYKSGKMKMTIVVN